MNRKNFIKTCGLACINGAAITTLLQGCLGTKIIGGKIKGDNLIVSLEDFETKAGKETHYKKYIVVQNELLQYPICVYRLNANEYAALWMQCTHQGAELQVFGDKLQCPAHGSEFDSKGHVQSGPAEKKLRSFPISIENNQLNISLKAV